MLVSVARGSLSSSNTFTLADGSYNVRFSVPVGPGVSGNKPRLWDITANASVIDGMSNYSALGDGGNTVVGSGRFTITSTHTFRLEHYTAATVGTVGLGQASGSGMQEKYSIIDIWQEFLVTVS